MAKTHPPPEPENTLGQALYKARTKTDCVILNLTAGHDFALLFAIQGLKAAKQHLSDAEAILNDLMKGKKP